MASPTEAQRKEGQQTLARSAVFFEDSLLLASHYECGMIGKPPVPVHCIGVKNLLTGRYETFYCPGNERAELERFAGYLEAKRNCAWVVWNMRNASFGFPHIFGRLRELGGNDHSPPSPDLVCDLSLIRWQFYGEVPPGPDGMFRYLARTNGIPTDGVMDPADVQTAVHMGNQLSVVCSVQRKLDIIDALWWKFKDATLSVQASPAKALDGRVRSAGEQRAVEQGDAGGGRNKKNLRWVSTAIGMLADDVERIGNGATPLYETPAALARGVGMDPTTVRRYLEQHKREKQNMLVSIWRTYMGATGYSSPSVVSMEDLGDESGSLRVTKRP